MLLLNPIVRKTSEKRSRWWTRLAGFGLWSVLQPICMSLNIRSIKEEHDDVYTAPFLVALWHNRTMVPGYAWSLAQKPLKMSVLTSASKDGALVEAVCRHFGLGAVRGSSGRRGALAYMEMMRKVQEGDVSSVLLQMVREALFTKCITVLSSWPPSQGCPSFPYASNMKAAGV